MVKSIGRHRPLLEPISGEFIKSTTIKIKTRNNSKESKKDSPKRPSRYQKKEKSPGFKKEFINFIRKVSPL